MASPAPTDSRPQPTESRPPQSLSESRPSSVRDADTQGQQQQQQQQNEQAGPAMPPTLFELLSRECQRRGFNPSWRERATRDGKFLCDVLLGDVLVAADRPADTPLQAKTAVAMKALLEIRLWPAPPGRNGRSSSNNQNVANNSNNNNNNNNNNHNPRRGARTSAVAVSSQPDSRRANDATHAPRQMTTTTMTTTPGIALLPEYVRGNGELTQAFLDGMAIGARLAVAGSSDSAAATAAAAASAPAPAPAPRRRSRPCSRSLSPPLRRRHADRYRPSYGD